MKKKFTLIELIIVIVVIGILAAMALPKVSGIVKNAKIVAMINDKEVLEKAILLHYQKYDNLPLLNEDQELIVLNNNISLTKLVQAEEVTNEDMKTIYTSLQETLKHYNDEEESIYRIDLSKTKNYLSKSLKYGTKKDDKDFYVYSTKTNNVYYYNTMINGDGEIQHSEFNTTLKESELVNKKKSTNFKDDIKNDFNDEEETDIDDKINIKIKDMKSGFRHFAYLDVNGDLYTWGDNQFGQLGIGNNIDQSTPQKVTFPNDAKMITFSISGNHSMAVDEKGHIYSWGVNQYGQLGLGQYSSYSKPQLVPINVGVETIALGGFLSMIVTTNKDVFVTGYNRYGALGFNDTKYRYSFERIPLYNIKEVYPGGEHTIATTTTGGIYLWGDILNKTLGLPSSSSQYSKPQYVSLPNNIKPIKVSCGYGQTLMLCDDGNFYTFGRGNYGKLGNGSTSSEISLYRVPLKDKVKDFVAGSDHSLVLLENGEVYSFGRNNCGQLGIGNMTNQTTPQLVQLPKDKKVKTLVAGYEYSSFLMENGELYSVGANEKGQLGLGHNLNQNTPQLVILP